MDLHLLYANLDHLGKDQKVLPHDLQYLALFSTTTMVAITQAVIKIGAPQAPEVGSESDPIITRTMAYKMMRQAIRGPFRTTLYDLQFGHCILVRFTQIGQAGVPHIPSVTKT